MRDKHIKIALTGKMRAGKDTVFSILAKELVKQAHKADEQISVNQFAFGDDLKLYAEAIFPEQFEDGKKPRELFQNFGQTMREFNPDVWVDKVANKVQRHGTKDGKKISFVTDLRQPNEYKYCKDNDFYIIKVTAPDEIRLARMNSEGDSFSQKSLEHETESHIDTYETDYIIHNQFSDYESLEFKVKQLAKDILIKEKVLENDKQSAV